VRKFGVDLSNNNGYATVDKLPRSVDFVYRKVTEGESFVDPDARHIYARCHATNRKTGGYHYAHPFNSGKAEAAFFLKHLQMREGDLIPALDVEVKASHVRAYCVDFAMHIWATKRCETLLYASTSFVESYIGSQIPHMQLWLADWSSSPHMPKGWPTWAIWQYKVGKFSGIGSVDFDTAKMPLLVYHEKKPVAKKSNVIVVLKRIISELQKLLKYESKTKGLR
jgi:lysozyme